MSSTTHIVREVVNQPMQYTIRDAFYVVEATDFEKLCLFGENEREWYVTWEHVSMGNMATIEHILVNGENLPVVVSVFYALLNGKVVAFYEPTSQVVDHRMVKAWLEVNSPAFAAGRKCDAMNFHLCLHAVENKVQVEAPPA